MLGTFIKTLEPDYWEEIPSKAAIAGMASLMVFIAYTMCFHGWVPLLSGTTLLIHESGHPIIGFILGDRMMVYGGTIFQLFFPLMFAWHFSKQSHSLGYVFGWIWEASSLINVGIYAADARSQSLTLVGNGDRIHDWNDILARWGLLNLDKLIGNLFMFSAWVIFIAMSYLLVRLWFASSTFR